MLQFCDLFEMYDNIAQISVNKKEHDLNDTSIIFIDATSYDCDNNCTTFHADYYVNSVELQDKYELAFIDSYSVLHRQTIVSDTEIQDIIYITFVLCSD